MKKINLKQKEETLNFAVIECIKFLENTDWADLSLGRHDVADTEIYAVVSEYNTRSVEESKWEAHKKFADLQVVLEGSENIYVSDLSNMESGEYHEDSDYLECAGACGNIVNMNTESGLLLMPNDVHMPCISKDNMPAFVKKCVFKIPMKYFE